MTEANSADGKRKRGGTGNFFIVDQRLWKAVCDADDINSAAAWLLLAQGTGANQRTTAWSVDAIMRYLGMGYNRGKEAIDKLIALRFIQYGEKHTQRKPRYDLLTFAEWDALRQKPRKRRNPSADADSDSNLIWLPNELVTGTGKSEKSPIHKLRAAGDPWALRLFVDLYHAQNLRDDGGIARKVLWLKYKPVELGERGPYRIVGFKPEGRWLTWEGPFRIHHSRPKPTAESQPTWDSLNILEHFGVLSFIPHLVENDTNAAELIHAVGIGAHGEHPIETQIGNEACRAGAAMCQPWQLTKAEGLIVCPISRDYPKAQIIGIARLHYRPHTKRTSAWSSNLQFNGPAWIDQYRRIAAEYATQQAAYA
ncbi:MAG: hypothetical protein ROO76_00330 [Terriglobia bacterium]|nr:hypothetical protein [Terriglobia bacterium]